MDSKDFYAGTKSSNAKSSQKGQGWTDQLCFLKKNLLFLRRLEIWMGA